MMRWTAYVQQDGDDLILPLPDELITQMGWKVGDVLVWDVRADGSVVLTKKASWYKILWSKIKLWMKK
jgi:hypothetical protein